MCNSVVRFMKEIDSDMSFLATASDSNEPSLCSLPREVVWNCLLHVPRIDHLNVSCVSKTLRSLVRSPEFNRLRSLRKGSVYVSFVDATDHYHWFTLRPIEKIKKIEYRLVPVSVPIPIPISPARSVAVGSEIYFVGRLPSRDLWIFDTRSEKLTQGPSMKVARAGFFTVGVVDGKIYVIEEEGETQVEVFDPKSRSWNYFLGEEKEIVDCITWLAASLKGETITRKGKKRKLEEIILRNEKIEDWDQVDCVCVVENVLYASFSWTGLMWFDAKLKEWKRLVRRDGHALYPFSVTVMAEYNGMLAVMWKHDKIYEKDVKCGLIALDRVGQGIRGKVEWSGVWPQSPTAMASGIV